MSGVAVDIIPPFSHLAGQILDVDDSKSLDFTEVCVCVRARAQMSREGGCVGELVDLTGARAVKLGEGCGQTCGQT
jgi:hypothetical protein